MNFEGYIDALAGNGETISLAMELLLPFYQVGSDFAWQYGPWLALFATAGAAAKYSAGQAKGADLLQPIGIFVAIAICLIPLPKSVTGLSAPFGLGPFVTYSVIQNFNSLIKESVESAQSQLTRGTPVPLSALSTMNQQYSQIFKGSEVEPLLQDYWGNCTNGVVNFDDHSKRHWLSVGLLGPGLLGLQPQDIESGSQYMSSILENSSDEASEMISFWDQRNGITDWDEMRREVAPELAKRKFPNGTGRSYKIPTEQYWKHQISEDPNEPFSGSGYLSLDAEGFSEDQIKAFMKIDEVAYMEATDGEKPPGWDSERFYADNCLELYQLSHMAMNRYYKGIEGQYSVPSQGNQNFRDFEKASSVTAYMGGLNTYYENSAARRLNDVHNSAARNGLTADQSTFSSAKDTALVAGQGVLHAITSFLLKINLDQWVLALLGTLSLAIAFLLVFFPFFVPFAFFSPKGDNSLSVVFKVIIMFQLTLSLAYVTASIGAMVMSVVNAYAASDYNNGGISTSSVAGLAVAINTACLIFPIYIARLSYMMMFGSMGVSAASGQTISAGKQAALGAMTALIGKKLLGGIGGRGRGRNRPDAPSPSGGTPGANSTGGFSGGAGGSPNPRLPSAPPQGGGPRQYYSTQRSIGTSQARLEGPTTSVGRTSFPGNGNGNGPGKGRYMNYGRKGETFDHPTDKPSKPSSPSGDDDPEGNQ